MPGQANRAAQLDESYCVCVRNLNTAVDKNSHILCKRFCGAFELALRGHDEMEILRQSRCF